MSSINPLARVRHDPFHHPQCLPMRTIAGQRRRLRRQQFAIAALALLTAQACLSQLAVAAETSGQYFQLGVRGFTPPGKLEPEALVTLQIDLGTREVCESRLAVIAKSKEVADAFGTGALWCSSESASAKLGYHGVFRNRTSGKTLHFESESVELCKTAIEAMTGGQAPNNKIEMATECQAR